MRLVAMSACFVIVGSGCFGDGIQKLRGATRLGTDPIIVKTESGIKADGYFNELCFGLPEYANVDTAVWTVLVRSQPVTLYAELFSQDGKRLRLEQLSSLRDQRGEWACLSSLALIRGARYARLDVWASRSVDVRDISWISTDKL